MLFSTDDDSDDMPLRPSNKYCSQYEENFARGLGFRQPSDFRYAGGDSGKHLKWFKLAHPDLPEPAHTDHCLCTHFIQKNRWIYHKSDPTTILTTGSCCIKRFKIPGQACPICDTAHKDRSDIWCSKCRGGKFPKGRTYRRTMLEDMEYCKRIMITRPGVFNVNQSTVHERNFVVWLRQQPEMADFVAEQENIAEVARIRAEDEKRRRELQALRASYLVAGKTTLGYGTHAKCTYKELYDHKRWYCNWVLKETNCGSGMAKFKQWLILGKELNE